MNFFMERFPASLLALAAAGILGTCTPRPPAYMDGIETACVPGASAEVTRERIVYAARLVARPADADVYQPIPLLEDCPPEALRDGIFAIESTGKGSADPEQWRMVRMLSLHEARIAARQEAE